MKILPFSVVIISKNEEANIARAIQSVLPVCDDIIVVDSGSTDLTITIAKNLGAHVIEHSWQGYSKQKNLGNDAAKYPYIFSIDADEAFSPELREELISLFGSGQLKTMYRVNLINHYGGKPIKHGAWYPDWHYRLFDKTQLHWKENDDVHEGLSYDAHTSKANLKEHLYHFTTQTDAYYLGKMENYARLYASKMKPKNKKGGILKAISSAAFRFFKEYFLQAGFLDGQAGFKIAKAHFIYTYKKYMYLGL
ncbi:MAG: glycosyltransferase family 2 protein [Bacteroidia bacterium]|nr:glycosyltransferase family 2 protein [Bacteroidia bacterium]